MAKKAPQGAQTKVETLTIRISPRMKFGLELLSRKQHRTLTSVAEWALDKALTDKSEGLWAIFADDYSGEERLFSILDEVWDPYEPDRMANLAFSYSYLLTYEEEVMWKLIKENEYFWKLPVQRSRSSLIIENLREYWETLKQVANGEKDVTALPASPKHISTDNAVTF